MTFADFGRRWGLPVAISLWRFFVPQPIGLLLGCAAFLFLCPPDFAHGLLAGLPHDRSTVLLLVALAMGGSGVGGLSGLAWHMADGARRSALSRRFIFMLALGQVGSVVGAVQIALGRG